VTVGRKVSLGSWAIVWY